ncbi:arrestin domain-containing protein 3-like [Bombus impatiens]|uniref:Arrestin domain-containing protein 3-like n=1 Tax=Bombus impatiens TaxID=132113 RepID=A0A6P6FBT5_BOMIM|nr:arrestin domain-containing protein 3-like [Bombus impatiens]
MASLKQFCIVFNKSSATYEPGEIVTGRIIIDATKEKHVKGLYFTVNGSAFVHWLENDAIDDIRSHSFSGKEEYFNFKHNILGISASQTGHTISHGRTEYSFSFRLPCDIPCSFEHDTGYVRYTMKVVLERAFKFNHECKAAFSVVSRFDLNLYREKCFAIHDETNKNFNCLCWVGQGSISLQIMVPCTGYVPGQIITTTIHYTSTPDIPIRKLSTKLLRTAHFRTLSNTMVHKKVLKKNRHMPPFPTHGRITSEILVPPIAPSDLQYCSIIDLEYEVIVTVHISGPYSKMKRHYPVLIGTIPLYRPALTLLHRGVASSTPLVAQPAVVTTSTPGPSSASNSPLQDRITASTAYLDIPPPSYEVGSSETPDIRDIHESEFVFGANIPFSPKYPVYNYPAPRLPNERL